MEKRYLNLNYQNLSPFLIKSPENLKVRYEFDTKHRRL
ncbi:hypothetical protein CSG_220 [Campylobacter fetus subsp. venerealis str. 84-112]|nr:hypothetical protein CSG_220 [Campylobacter fetus subsp. venerealis str. 84-112]